MLWTLSKKTIIWPKLTWQVHKAGLKFTLLNTSWQVLSGSSQVTQQKHSWWTHVSPLERESRLRSSICWHKPWGFPNLVVYLDDWFIVAPTYKDCLNAMNTPLILLRKLGFQINYSRVEGPSQCWCFSASFSTLRTWHCTYPRKKIADFTSTRQRVKSHQKVTKRKLQSLAGKLNWASQCIYSGRIFMRSILNKMNFLKLPWHRTRLTFITTFCGG